MGNRDPILEIQNVEKDENSLHAEQIQDIVNSVREMFICCQLSESCTLLHLHIKYPFQIAV